MRRVLHNCSENLLIWVALSFIAGAAAAYNCTSLASLSSIAAFVLPVLVLLAVASCLLPPTGRSIVTLPFFIICCVALVLLSLFPSLSLALLK